MALAICKVCGKEIYWRAQRGMKLSDHRCPCGGELAGKTAGRTATSPGGHFSICAVCGRRKLHVLTTTREWVTVLEKVIPAGSTVCRWHEVKDPLSSLGHNPFYEVERNSPSEAIH